MNLELQNYNSEFFRPTPIVLDSQNLALVATLWGHSETLAPLIQRLFEHLESEISQLENKTSIQISACVEQSLQDLNSDLNDLNRDEWLFVVECLIVVRHKHKVLFYSVGQHFVFSNTQSQGFAVLVAQDISNLNSRPSEKLSPLPSHCLGIDQDIMVHRGSCRATDHQKFFLCSKTEFKAAELIEFSQNVQSMTEHFALNSQQMPFWLAQLEVQNVSTD